MTPEIIAIVTTVCTAIDLSTLYETLFKYLTHSFHLVTIDF